MDASDLVLCLCRRSVPSPDAVSSVMPARGAMRLRALALSLVLIWGFQAVTAQPTVTPGIQMIATGGGNVDAGNGAVLLNCIVTNPSTAPTPPAPTGTVYFVGVSHHSLVCTDGARFSSEHDLTSHISSSLLAHPVVELYTTLVA